METNSLREAVWRTRKMAKTDHRLGGGREKEVGSRVSISRRRFLMHEQPNKTPDIYQSCYSLN